MELQPDHEALAAHVLDDLGIFVLERLQALQEVVAGDGGVVDQPLVDRAR